MDWVELAWFVLWELERLDFLKGNNVHTNDTKTTTTQKKRISPTIEGRRGREACDLCSSAPLDFPCSVFLWPRFAIAVREHSILLGGKSGIHLEKERERLWDWGRISFGSAEPLV